MFSDLSFSPSLFLSLPLLHSQHKLHPLDGVTLLLRLGLLMLHATWLINSATHIWGYRNYEISDHSRNLWWVAMLTNGEGWHNNHHAYPRMARHGHKWWEFDMTFMVIKAMEMCGLAWNVVDGQHKKAEAEE